MKIACSIRGVAPLLQHRFADEEHPEKKVVKGGKVFSSQSDAEGALYKTKAGVIFQPSNTIEGAMKKASVKFKIPGAKMKTYKDIVVGGVFIDPLEVTHKNQKWVIQRDSVRIQNARIMRSRPRFDEWELDFTMNVIDDRAEEHVLKEILSDAGLYYGIGDWRPRYGRFEVTKFKVMK
jgi:hypothetical protein